MSEESTCAHMKISIFQSPIPMCPSLLSIHTNPMMISIIYIQTVTLMYRRWLRSRSDRYSQVIRDSKVVRTKEDLIYYLLIKIHMHIYRAWWPRGTPLGPHFQSLHFLSTPLKNKTKIQQKGKKDIIEIYIY